MQDFSLLCVLILLWLQLILTLKLIWSVMNVLQFVGMFTLWTARSCRTFFARELRSSRKVAASKPTCAFASLPIHIVASCLLARQVSACASPANSIKCMWSEWPSHGLSSMIGIRYCWSRRLTTLISSPLSFAKHRDAVTCPTWRTARRCRGVRRVPSPCAPSPRWSWVGTISGGWSSRQVDRLCFKLIVYSTLNLTWWIYFWGSGFIFTSDFYFRFVVYFMQSSKVWLLMDYYFK